MYNLLSILLFPPKGRLLTLADKLFVALNLMSFKPTEILLQRVRSKHQKNDYSMSPRSPKSGGSVPKPGPQQYSTNRQRQITVVISPGSLCCSPQPG